MRIDMRLNLTKNKFIYLFAILTSALLNSCSVFKSCDCPGLGALIDKVETTQHS
jgi:hypothetical protein